MNINLKQAVAAPARAASSFPVGYHDLHPDISINFQLNRFYGWVGDDSMLTEMRVAAAGLAGVQEASPRSRPASLSPLELDEVLENERGPGFSPRLDEQTALGELPQLDRREAELLHQRRHPGGRVFVVA
jgi:hypothetical protein